MGSLRRLPQILQQRREPVDTPLLHGTVKPKTIDHFMPSDVLGKANFRIRSVKESQFAVDPPTPESFFTDRYKPPGHLTISEKCCDDSQELCRRAAVAVGQIEHLMAHFIQRFLPDFTDADLASVDTLAPAMTEALRASAAATANLTLVWDDLLGKWKLPAVDRR